MPKHPRVTAEATSATLSPLPTTAVVSPTDMPVVIERLLIAGLHEQDLADELRRQLAFTAAVSGSVAEGMYALDLAGAITFVNPAAERLLGWTAAEVLGTEAHALLHLHCTAGLGGLSDRCPLLEVTHTGISYRNGEDTFRRKDGTVLPVAYSAAPILLDGAVTGSIVVFSDETSRHLMEQQREEFFETVAHDLGSPITVIIGIPPPDLPHIFERFHRGSNVVGRIPGTGIGLHGARQIIEQHGGTMVLESPEDQGTKVTVRLPLFNSVTS